MQTIINFTNSTPAMVALAIIGLAVVGMDVYVWRP